MENTPKIRCARCGQPIQRETESWKQTGDQVVHASCSVRSAASASTPVSETVKTLPRLSTELAPGRPQFMRIEDAAKMLAVSAKTIQRRIRSGELPAQRLKGTAGGGRETILLNQADVLALLEPYTGTEENKNE